MNLLYFQSFQQTISHAVIYTTIYVPRENKTYSLPRELITSPIVYPSIAFAGVKKKGRRKGGRKGDEMKEITNLLL